MMSNRPEDGLLWRKSTASASGNCVEVAVGGGLIHVRDSKKAPAGPALAFTAPEWNAFLTGVRDGEFNLEVLS
jgi:predicted secreted Zn-dependent protease